MPRSMIQRLTLSVACRIRQNQRHLSYASSSSALHEASPSPSSSSPSPSPSFDAVHLTDNCVRRMRELQASEASADEKMLRLCVETGGCSGFQYVFDLDGKTHSDDRVFERDGVKLVVDNISYDFVKGSTIDYVEELIRSAFVMSQLNPTWGSDLWVPVKVCVGPLVSPSWQNTTKKQE
ncbi:Iron-sulfur assembly protein IscA-like 2, mitochondrial [Morella rubra]|uniref:Iron-sulfur assembly protein IscA-like 2, mitochondrial n=1 Tax=Morella rubra TaxID=262757 RepID=A0A6A1WI79_9ROSI|nr:Iron-sulfur assembly protein IscA-like 2, mitochondrial [Morella rubra]